MRSRRNRRSRRSRRRRSRRGGSNLGPHYELNTNPRIFLQHNKYHGGSNWNPQVKAFQPATDLQESVTTGMTSIYNSFAGRAPPVNTGPTQDQFPKN